MGPLQSSTMGILDVKRSRLLAVREMKSEETKPTLMPRYSAVARLRLHYDRVAAIFQNGMSHEHTKTSART